MLSRVFVNKINNLLNFIKYADKFKNAERNRNQQYNSKQTPVIFNLNFE